MVSRVALLEQQLKSRDKTIRVLSERMERHLADDVSSFALFEQNIALEKVVAMRTHELEQALEHLKSAQTDLLQAQKQQAIGQLAAGIAHEINTPTQYLGNNVSFLRDSFDTLLRVLRLCQELLQAEAGEQSLESLRQGLQKALDLADIDFLGKEVPRALNDSAEGVKRISDIVGAMQDFAQPSGGKMLPVELDSLIHAAVAISRYEWKDVAEISTDLDPSLPCVAGLKDELAQALLNLIINAAHAIADGRRGGKAEGRIHIITRRRDDWAELSVEDNGCGIPQELQDKIFDPFFTTKDVGKGRGQGLAIVYNVITGKHHGRLFVHSEPGSGTTITVSLPLMQGVNPNAA